jgi:predicted metalloendopeptidase
VEASARAVLALETALAQGQWARVDTRDPVKAYTRVELVALAPLAPGFDWPAWLGAAGLAGKTGDVIVQQPSYLATVAAQLAATPLPVWKAYLRTHLLSSYASFLARDFVDARFAFVGTTLSGTTENLPRWKRAVGFVEASAGESLGKLYVDAYFPPASKARMERLVANLLAAYRESIDAIDWMSPATKKEAQAKLATFAPKIGYPKRWIDYSALETKKGDLIGNVRRAREFDYARELAKLGKPVDRDEWFLTPQTVNAYYNASLNEIVFPASVLQPPFFDPAADDAVNYGAIGAIIGHEISHGFDDEGSQFDGTGNLRVWWTDEDRKRFDAKTRILVSQYSAFSPFAGYHVNGELTLGENIADNAGLEIAYKAYHRSLAGKPAPVIDGTSGDERFFYGFAQAFRGKARDAVLLTQMKSDPHSPDEFRVNGAVRNHPAFYATFAVKPGDPMYLPPEQRVSIW